MVLYPPWLLPSDRVEGEEVFGSVPFLAEVLRQGGGEEVFGSVPGLLRVSRAALDDRIVPASITGGFTADQ